MARNHKEVMAFAECPGSKSGDHCKECMDDLNQYVGTSEQIVKVCCECKETIGFRISHM